MKLKVGEITVEGTPAECVEFMQIMSQQEQKPHEKKNGGNLN